MEGEGAGDHGFEDFGDASDCVVEFAVGDELVLADFSFFEFELLVDYGHDEVEFVFCSFICVVILEYNRRHINTRCLPTKQPLHFLQHNQNFPWPHTMIPIIITNIIHLTKFLFFLNIRYKTHTQHKINQAHRCNLLIYKPAVLCKPQRLESLEHGHEQVFSDRRGLKEFVHD